MRNFLEDFKKFILRGNVIDLAVGIMIGTSFNGITNSLVNNIITPPLGLLLGRIDFKNWGVNLGGNVNIQYGLFVQAIINFIITAFALFLIIEFITKLRRPKDDSPAPAEKTPELLVLEEIRDELKGGTAQAAIQA